MSVIMSWKRKLFFGFERLKITPAERISVSVLSVVLVGLSLVNVTLERESPFDEEHYAELKEEFMHRAAEIKQQEQEKLNRYTLPSVSVSDTTEKDTTEVNSVETSFGSGSSRININTADAQTLQELNGIGPTYAERIVAYREENGPFTSVEELMEIKGIGEKRLEKLKPFIKLKEQIEN